MNNEHEYGEEKSVTTTVSPECIAMIDKYANERNLYRSNWLRGAILEKLEREFSAEKARHAAVKGAA